MKKSVLLSAFLIILFSSCKKNQLGGNATIKGAVMHHAKKIPNAIVYIKYNAKEFPGTDVSVYDNKVTADADANYTIKCYKGDYYLYGVGFDNALGLPVTGGTPVNIRNHETVNIDVAVTE